MEEERRGCHPADAALRGDTILDRMYHTYDTRATRDELALRINSHGYEGASMCHELGTSNGRNSLPTWVACTIAPLS